MPRPPATTSREALKRAAAEHAVSFVQSGMVVGLGAGSTAAFAVRRLGVLVGSGVLAGVRAVGCARVVEEEARRLGLVLLADDDAWTPDLTIDGADEVDGALNLIKGAGGALLREKIVAQASRREIIVIDAGKLSPRLGTRAAVPVEVVDFGWPHEARYLEALGAKVSLRRDAGGLPVRTDAGHLLLDARFGPLADPPALARQLEARAGIVGHGLFLGLATDVIVASERGIEHRRRDGLEMK